LYRAPLCPDRGKPPVAPGRTAQTPTHEPPGGYRFFEDEPGERARRRFDVKTRLLKNSTTHFREFSTFLEPIDPTGDFSKTTSFQRFFSKGRSFFANSRRFRVSASTTRATHVIASSASNASQIWGDDEFASRSFFYDASMTHCD